MNIKEARRLANDRFIKLLQPVLDGQKIDHAKFNQALENLKKQLAEETGYQVERWYVDPIGPGMCEVTTLFKSDVKKEKTKRKRVKA